LLERPSHALASLGSLDDRLRKIASLARLASTRDASLERCSRRGPCAHGVRSATLGTCSRGRRKEPRTSELQHLGAARKPKRAIPPPPWPRAACGGCAARGETP